MPFRLCDGLTDQPASEQPPKGSRAALLADIELGFTELGLNVEQQKTYTMKALNLKHAPDLSKADVAALQTILNAITDDLR